MLAIHQRVQSKIDQTRRVLTEYRDNLIGGAIFSDYAAKLDLVEERLSLSVIHAISWSGSEGAEIQCMSNLRSDAVISDINLLIANLQTAIRNAGAALVIERGGITAEMNLIINNAICAGQSLMEEGRPLTLPSAPSSTGVSYLCKCGGTYRSFDGEECCSQCLRLRGEILNSNDWMNAHIPGSGAGMSTRAIVCEKHRRHYRIWIERIQALDSQNFSDSDITLIRENLARYRIPIKTLNCTIMREKLKELRLTRYNYTIPLIIKTLGGPAPPTLTIEESDYVDGRFLRIVELFSAAFPQASNTPYYPYFIYKIIEATFDVNHPRRGLLSFIHLQSLETVIKNDKYFEKICQNSLPSDNLVYKPTQRI